jgi:hypothetical protein
LYVGDVDNGIDSHERFINTFDRGYVDAAGASNSMVS